MWAASLAHRAISYLAMEADPDDWQTRIFSQRVVSRANAQFISPESLYNTPTGKECGPTTGKCMWTHALIQA